MKYALCCEVDGRIKVMCNFGTNSHVLFDNVKDAISLRDQYFLLIDSGEILFDKSKFCIYEFSKFQDYVLDAASKSSEGVDKMSDYCNGKIDHLDELRTKIKKI